MSPTQRTLTMLREAGYTAWVTEHWNHFAKIRQDLFGFIDILAIRSGEILGVQATSAPNVWARVRKILDSIYSPLWLSAGGKIKVVGWKQVPPLKRWVPVVKVIAMIGGVPSVVEEPR